MKNVRTLFNIETECKCQHCICTLYLCGRVYTPLAISEVEEKGFICERARVPCPLPVRVKIL